MLEESLRDVELRAQQQLADEQRRNKEIMVRVEREKQLEIENCNIKYTSWIMLYLVIFSRLDIIVIIIGNSANDRYEDKVVVIGRFSRDIIRLETKSGRILLLTCVTKYDLT